MNEYKFQITGMSCTSCARTVEKVIGTFHNVLKVKVDFTSSTALIVSKEDINIQEIKGKLNQFGYDLLPTTETISLEKELKNIIVAILLSIPLFVVMVLKMFNIHIIPHSLDILMFGLSAIIVLLNGFNIHRSGMMSLVYLSPNMDSLVSLGSIFALLTFFISKVLPIGDFSMEAVIVMDVFLVGNYLKIYFSSRAIGSVKELYKMLVDFANVIENGVEVVKNVNEVKEGDIILVKPGEKIPIDAEVVEGQSAVDEKFITGEPLPRIVKLGDTVFGGSYNVDGVLKLKARKNVKDSLLYQIIRFVEETRMSKLPFQNFADTFIKYFVPIVFLVSLGSLIFWLSLGNINRGIIGFISVLVIACPCALGIAIPTALAVAIGVFSKNGVILRNINSLHFISKMNLFALDKTGTITLGKPQVLKAEIDPEYVYSVYSLFCFSTHPLSISAKEYIKREYLKNDNKDIVPYVDEFKVIPGEGIEGKVNGKTIKIVRSKDYDETTSSEIFVDSESGVKKIGKIWFYDKVREDAKDTIKFLRKFFDVVMLTGDKCKVASKVSQEVGIASYYCELFPQDKVNVITGFRSQGKKVCFVGDGINDTPVLSASDVGIVMSERDNVVTNVGDIVIVNDKLNTLKFIVSYSKRVYAKMIQNIIWAFGYNIIAIPLAFMGLLTPSIAEVAMALSSISVVLNSLTLYKHKFS